MYLLAYQYHRARQKGEGAEWGGRNRGCPERGLCKKAVLMPQAGARAESSQEEGAPVGVSGDS